MSLICAAVRRQLHSRAHLTELEKRWSSAQGIRVSGAGTQAPAMVRSNALMIFKFTHCKDEAPVGHGAPEVGGPGPSGRVPKLRKLVHLFWHLQSRLLSAHTQVTQSLHHTHSWTSCGGVYCEGPQFMVYKGQHSCSGKPFRGVMRWQPHTARGTQCCSCGHTSHLLPEYGVARALLCI